MRFVYYGFIIILTVTTMALSQTEKKKVPDIYDTSLDGMAQIQAAVSKALKSDKHVLVQLGGNWCSWCHKLHKLFTSDETIGNMLAKNYEVVYVNYSKENKNEEVLNKYQHPNRFGFPVLLVLNAKGELLHTQDSALLEGGKVHDPEKVKRFLELWSKASLEQSDTP